MTLPAEIQVQIDGMDWLTNCNRWQLAKECMDILALGEAKECVAETRQALARAIERTTGYVDELAQAARLRAEFEKECPTEAQAWVKKVRITVWLEVAASYYGKKIKGEDVTALLTHCHDEALEGNRVTVEQVKDLLPHDEREVSFLGRARRIIPMVIRLFNSPAMDFPEDVYRTARRHFEAGWKALEPYLEER